MLAPYGSFGACTIKLIKLRDAMSGRLHCFFLKRTNPLDPNYQGWPTYTHGILMILHTFKEFLVDFTIFSPVTGQINLAVILLQE